MEILGNNSNKNLLEARMITVYINEKRVSKDEIEKIEIRDEVIKKLLSEKIEDKKNK